MTRPSRHDRYHLPIGRRMTGRWRVLPDFIIIGAQKAGTTTLYDNLAKHPAIQSCDIKEVHFFDTNWSKGENWYRGHFPTQREKSAALARGESWTTGEGSPYYMFHPLVPERVKSVTPNSKLIVILRNPIDRAYSHYQHEVRKGREPLSFKDALADEEKRLLGEESRIINGSAASSFTYQHYSYKSRGYYVDQLQRWFDRFPREQFLILESSELNGDFEGTFARLHQFLGVESIDLPQPKRRNVGVYEDMDADVRTDLTEHFAPYNERLFELLGRRYDWR